MFSDRLKPKLYWLGGFVASLSTGANAAMAQNLFFNDSPYDPFGQYTYQLMFARIVIMAVSIGMGFALGWLISPGAREFRMLIFKAVAFLTITIAVFNNGSLGWSLTWLVAWIGFFVAIGYWTGRTLRWLGEVPQTFGSSRWADSEHILENNVFGDEGIRLGLASTGKYDAPISYKGDRHLLTVAPTRSQKGTTQIIPNLLTYTGSVLVIDPKGENALVTSRERAKMGQAVHILDPWHIATTGDRRSARFNPLDWLKPGDVDITENAMLLADALIVADGDGDRFWIEEAKALLQGIILYVATDENESGQRHLARVRDLLLLDGDDLKTLFTRMLESPHHIVASTGARCLQKEEKLLANVIASAQAQTHFLDSARIRESLSASDFKFEDLKAKAMTVYVVLPADRLHTFGRWLRLMVQQAITVNARNIAVKPKQPVLFLLDELPALGKLAMVEQAYGLMAGFGMQLWGIVQDLSQLRMVYGEGWETFIGNSGVVQYFGSHDRMTADYFSALCGETTVWNLSSALSKVVGTSHGQGGITSSSSSTTTDTQAASQRKLAYPDELMRMHKTKQLIFIENMLPIMATKVPWFENPELSDKGVNLRKP